MKTLSILALGATLFIASCSKDAPTMPDTSSDGARHTAMNDAPPVVSGTMQAYYHDALVDFQYRYYVGLNAHMLLSHTTMVPNEIYTYDPTMSPHGSLYKPVLKLVRSDESTLPSNGQTLWREIRIMFNEGIPPHQFYNDSELDAALQARQITVMSTDNLYRLTPMPAPTYISE